MLLSGLLLSGLERVHIRDARVVSQLRTATAALAVERFRRAHAGVLPGNLEALMPAYLSVVPADPYDGQPVRFTRNGAAYAIDCVGPDRKDDGGVNWKSVEIKNPLDVAFLVQHEGRSKK